MHATISRFRQAWIARRTSAAPKPHVPFRQSIWPAILSSAVFTLLASLILTIPLAWTSHAIPILLTSSFLTIALSVGFFWVAFACFPLPTPRYTARFSLLFLTLLLALSISTLSFVSIQFLSSLINGNASTPLSILLLSCIPILLPTFIAPAMLTLLISPSIGILTGIGQALLFALQISLFASNQDGFSPDSIQPLVIAGMLSCIVSAVLVPHLIQRTRVHSRTGLIRIAPLAAIAPIIGILGGGLAIATLSPVALTAPLSNPWSWVGMSLVLILLSFVSCLFQAGTVAISHSVFEHILDFTSNITLQTYSDLENGLLDRLATEAPGTHSHCISVAIIAAKAAESIGANSILTRIGAYYHDIGKLKKPSLFTENQLGGENPLNLLPPKTSASWLRSHVKDGISLADLHKLPTPVRDLIAEHHGTTTMSFFLHKAQQDALAAGLPAESVDESLFRYEGPKPSSRESGILMIADSVEAACRSLQKPTPRAIESKVAEIVRGKLLDGQFDECPLSLADLSTVRKSLTNSLIAILHSRIAYPAPEPAPAADPTAPAQPQ